MRASAFSVVYPFRGKDRNVRGGEPTMCGIYFRTASLTMPTEKRSEKEILNKSGYLGADQYIGFVVNMIFRNSRRKSSRFVVVSELNFWSVSCKSHLNKSLCRLMYNPMLRILY